MISLLLTLFISLFAVCPTYHQVDYNANNVIVYSDSISRKNTIDSGVFTIYSLSECLAREDVFLRIYSQNVGFFRDSTTNDNSYIYPIGDGVSSTSLIAKTDYLQFGNNYVAEDYYYYFDSVRYTLINYGDWGYDNDIYYRGFYVTLYNSVESQAVGDSLRFELYYNKTTYQSDIDTNFIYSPLNFNGTKDYLIRVYYTAINTLNLFATSSDTFEEGYASGYQNGYDRGNELGTADGYQRGYVSGYNDGTDVDDTASTIMTGIFDVGLLPVNVFLTIFNFEVFGVNIAGIISGLLTLSVVIIILRFLLGGKNDDK